MANSVGTRNRTAEKRYRQVNPIQIWQYFKLENKIKDILTKSKKHSSYEKDNKKITEHLDTLKQKLVIKSHRLARYKKAKNRKESNRLFTVNEKQFYRKMKESNKQLLDPPDVGSIKQFWSTIWECNTEHNKETDWIQREKVRMDRIEEMSFEDISQEELQIVLNKSHNWKAPGTDGIHNYWLKKLTIFHKCLAKQITDIIKGSSIFPEFLSRGKTFLLPKSTSTQDPSQYRPITCLPTLYKVITSCIANRIYKHLDEFNILSEEQKGCRRKHMGCKEQLIIDSTILKHVQKRRKDLFVAYIDYQKAFDSIPHSWLTEVLEIYKVHPTIITFLKNVMQTWRTTLNLQTNTTLINAGEVNIKRGIFQGDSLSPLWFCLALNPLSRELNDSKAGFDIKNNRQTLFQITHLLYVDDLKLYSNTNLNMKKILD